MSSRIHLLDRRKLHGVACNHIFRRSAPKRTRDPRKVTCRMCLGSARIGGRNA